MQICFDEYDQEAYEEEEEERSEILEEGEDVEEEEEEKKGVMRMRTSTACSMTLMRSLIIHLKSTSEGTLILGR